MTAQSPAGTYATEALVPSPHPVPSSAPALARALVQTHRTAMGEALEAISSRRFLSRYPESPSPRVHGADAAEAGRAAFERHRDRPFDQLLDQPPASGRVGSETSAYGPDLGIGYPDQDVEPLLSAAAAGMRAWREAGAEVRAAVCLEAVDRIHTRSFEIAHAVMHTTGQPFVMAFQAGGPHAQDRALEAIAYALFEQRRVPPTALWEKPAKGDPIRLTKDYHLVPRGISLVIGCNTFPTWNSYPGLFASLATGNAVVVKPHPRAVLPLAISVAAVRNVLRDHGYDPNLVTLMAESDGEGRARALATHPAVRIIDYTGGPAFGEWLETEVAGAGRAVYTEKAGVNTVVIDSVGDLRGMLSNLAFSLSLYSGQMCTTPQNIFVPRAGVETDEGHLSFEDFGDRLAQAIQRLTDDDGKAVEILGATVNDGVRQRAAGLPALAAAAEGALVLDSRLVAHPSYPEAVVRSPGLVAVDVIAESAYGAECFGPVSFLIATDSTAQSVAKFEETVRQRGAMTAAVYSVSEAVLEAVREAAMVAGVALSENLTGPVFVNQTAAFSDFHGTGANPAANAAYTDSAFVAGRFRVVTTRRHP